jgi:hypothetical protein
VTEFYYRVMWFIRTPQLEQAMSAILEALSNGERVDRTIPGTLDGAQQLLDAIRSRFSIVLEHGDYCVAAYKTVSEKITLPYKEYYSDLGRTEDYYATAFHEIGHWTWDKIPGRIRPPTKPGLIDANYARDEIVAEIVTSLLCSEAHISRKSIILEVEDPYACISPDSVAAVQSRYLAAWIGKLKRISPETALQTVMDAIHDGYYAYEFLMTGIGRGVSEDVEVTEIVGPMPYRPPKRPRTEYRLDSRDLPREGGALAKVLHDPYLKRKLGLAIARASAARKRGKEAFAHAFSEAIMATIPELAEVPESARVEAGRMIYAAGEKMAEVAFRAALRWLSGKRREDS